MKNEKKKTGGKKHLKRKIVLLEIMLLVSCVLFAAVFYVKIKSGGHVSDEKESSADRKETEAENESLCAEEENGAGTESAGTETAVQDGGTEEIKEEENAQEPVKITISAVGDVTLGVNQKTSYSGSFHEYYDLYGEGYFLKNVRDIFAADDFTIVNCEGTLTNSSNIRASKEWNHKGKPEYAQILANASVEAATLGNNHIMDYQQEGVDDTIASLRNVGVEYALNGIWGNHYGFYETQQGISIGFVSVNEYYDGKSVYPYLEDGLHTLREQGADIVIACMHWGGDKVHTLEKEQYEIGHWCIEQGYDLVLGCHPHVLQGIECYQGKYIVYSMGNFCYGGSKNPKEKDSMIFQQTFYFMDGQIQEESDVRVIPCSLSGAAGYNDYCPTVLTGQAARQLIENLNDYSREFGLAFDEDGYFVTVP